MYKGDILEHIDTKTIIKVINMFKDIGFDGCLVNESGTVDTTRKCWGLFEYWTWPKTEVKLLAYYTGVKLEWFSEGTEVLPEFKRVPSEDKVITLGE